MTAFMRSAGESNEQSKDDEITSLQRRLRLVESAHQAHVNEIARLLTDMANTRSHVGFPTADAYVVKRLASMARLALKLLQS